MKLPIACQEGGRDFLGSKVSWQIKGQESLSLQITSYSEQDSDERDCLR